MASTSAPDALAFLNEHLGGWNRAMGLTFVSVSADLVVGELTVTDVHRQPFCRSAPASFRRRVSGRIMARCCPC